MLRKIMENKDDLEPIRPRPMSKAELSAMYAPNLKPASALNRLAMWIRHNPDLVAALAETHYNVRQQIFSSKQVRLIFEYLGEP